MKKKTAVIGGIICWGLFLIILTGVVTHAAWITSFDHEGYRLLQPTTPIKTTIFTIITRLGDPLIVLPLTILVSVVLWWKRQIGTGLWVLGLQFVGYALVIIAKYSVLRVRPSYKLIPANGYSFPSGHTFATTIFIFTLLMLILPKLQIHWQKWLLIFLGFCWIIAVMTSRVYLRNHFSSDVCAGFLLACGWWAFNQAGRGIFIKWLLSPFHSSTDTFS